MPYKYPIILQIIGMKSRIRADKKKKIDVY